MISKKFSALPYIADIQSSDNKKGLNSNWILTLQKNDIIFCDGVVFPLDRDLLMGTSNTS